MGAAILVLQWQGENFFLVEKFEISHFQAVHCVRKNAMSPKVFNRFSKTFHLLKDVESRYLGRKFHGRSYFSFAMARRKLNTRVENLKFHSFELYTVSEKMLYHQRYSTDFQKLSICWKMWTTGISVRKFHGRSYFSFAVARWKLFSGGKIWNFPLSSSTLCQKKCYVTKGIQPIFKNFPSAESCGK